MATCVAETCRRYMVCMMYFRTIMCVCWFCYDIVALIVITSTVIISTADLSSKSVSYICEINIETISGTEFDSYLLSQNWSRGYTGGKKFFREVIHTVRVLSGHVLKCIKVSRIRIGARHGTRCTCSRSRDVPKSLSGSEYINGRCQDASTLALTLSNE